MISKADFIKRASQMGLAEGPTLSQQINSDWDVAARTADVLESQMPSIGILSESKRIGCFLSVCTHIDRLMESGQLTLDAAMLALLILQVTNKDFLKAYGLFMHRAPNIPWQEAINFPQMALEFFKAARGQ
jgi:hypothetical protein